jgi:hypothetical protein
MVGGPRRPRHTSFLGFLFLASCGCQKAEKPEKSFCGRGSLDVCQSTGVVRIFDLKSHDPTT